MIFPFGYEMKDGTIQIKPSEKDRLKRIFEDYLSGSSMQEIADRLTSERVPHSNGRTEWNKSRIKRIIEDARYLGNEDYPPLIDEQTFRKCQQQKSLNNTYKKPTESQPCRMLEQKLFCTDCGSKYIKTRNGFACENGCKTKRPLNKEAARRLLSSLTEALKADPSLLDDGETDMLSLEIARMTNEVNRALERREVDEDALTALLIKCAEEKYAEASKTTSYQMNLHRDFILDEPVEEILKTDILGRFIREAYINHDLSVFIRLANGKKLDIGTGE